MKKLLCLFFLIGCAWAEPVNDSLSNLLQNMHSFSANFVQTITDNGKTLQKSTGQMWLQRPGQFRWQVNSPIKQTIIAHGKRLWIYDPDLEQVTIRSFSKTAGQTPAMLLSDPNISLSQDFNVKSTGVDSFTLTPKNKNEMLVHLKLSFSNKMIHKMELEDHLGHITVIQFNHAKINPTLAASLFNFVPPKSIDIIDETKR